MTVLAIIVAVAAGILLGTKLSQAGRLTTPLAQFRGQEVAIHVWGRPLPVAEVKSVRALGPGLHVFLRDGHLKIAQPRSVTVGERLIVVGEAAYVQWRGKRLPRVSGQPAVTIARQ